MASSEKRIITAAISAVCALLFLLGLFLLGRSVGSASGAREREVSALELAPAYTQYINNLSSAAMDGVMTIARSYQLAEDTVVAPAPIPTSSGESADPAVIAEVVSQAAPLLDGQELLWSEDTPAIPGTAARWYLDETILSLAWKQEFYGCAFNFCEVKVSHPSQFRRYLADNTFASPIQYRPTEMAAAVNAVTAMSADFYKFRNYGVVVYQRQLYRSDGKTLDICYVDGDGNLNYVRRGELTDEAAIRQYIEDNDILFSLAFGPVMIENGEDTLPGSYPIGEINNTYSRSVLCQLGDCHYLLVTVNYEDGYPKTATLRQTTDALLSLGVPNAYALDGGQTASLILNGSLYNHVDWGEERTMSDIIYFATAIPDESGGEGEHG